MTDDRKASLSVVRNCFGNFRWLHICMQFPVNTQKQHQQKQHEWNNCLYNAQGQYISCVLPGPHKRLGVLLDSPSGDTASRWQHMHITACGSGLTLGLRMKGKLLTAPALCPWASLSVPSCRSHVSVIRFSVVKAPITKTHPVSPPHPHPTTKRSRTRAGFVIVRLSFFGQGAVEWIKCSSRKGLEYYWGDSMVQLTFNFNKLSNLRTCIYVFIYLFIFQGGFSCQLCHHRPHITHTHTHIVMNSTLRAFKTLKCPYMPSCIAQTKSIMDFR